MKFFIYLSPFIFLPLLAVTVIEYKNNLLCPYDMIHNYNYVCTGTRKGQRLERVAIIFFLFNNNYYSHTDWYNIITIVQTSKLAACPAGLLVKHIMK